MYVGIARGKYNKRSYTFLNLKSVVLTNQAGKTPKIDEQKTVIKTSLIVFNE